MSHNFPYPTPPPPLPPNSSDLVVSFICKAHNFYRKCYIYIQFVIIPIVVTFFWPYYNSKYSSNLISFSGKAPLPCT